MANHHDAVGHFPSGGWGWNWTGVPSRGSGAQQPGGWIFSVLPYTEYQALYNSTSALTGAPLQQAIIDMLKTPVPIVNWPTRRSGGPFPNG